jgi:hypothetical protein
MSNKKSIVLVFMRKTNKEVILAYEHN